MDRPPVSSPNYLRLAIIGLIALVLIVILYSTVQYWAFWR
jgi:hypothetical protein